MLTTGSPIEPVDLNLFKIDSSVKLFILREDLNQPKVKNGHLISGNKWRKLKYNIQYVVKNRLEGMLTFGGAYSNHLHAVAAAGKIFNFKTIGIVRGEELANKTNATIEFCKQQNMQLHYWSRKEYRNKEAWQKELLVKYPEFLIVPEGGTNNSAFKGVEEIWENPLHQYDVICTPIGTGGTFTGLITGSKGRSNISGFPALKADFTSTIKKNLEALNYTHKNWQFNTNYHFGGFAKVDNDLINFIKQFKSLYNIQLEPLYTGKMMYGIFDMIKQNCFEDGNKIIAMHTGGLQGLKGFKAFGHK